MIQTCKPHIMCLSETHLAKGQEIYVENYVFFGKNRQSRHRLAPKTHGGVGILVRNDVLDDFSCVVHDRSIEGVIAIKLHRKRNDYVLVVFACYLPPENSPWGRSPDDIFAHLTGQMYLLEDVDDIVICGDFNARIGQLNDSDAVIDSVVPTRGVIDPHVNAHGHALVDFLIENKLCVLNGRYADDGFTCVSPRGSSVVDYICVPHVTLRKCTDFRVISNYDLVDSHHLHDFIGPKSRLPDHCLLICGLSIEVAPPDSDMTSTREGNDVGKRYVLKEVPREFLGSDEAREMLGQIIETIGNWRNVHNEVENLYTSLVKCIVDEMDRVLPSFTPGRSRRYYRRHKPYWNSELQTLWRSMHEAERVFVKYRGPSLGKVIKRMQFKDSAHAFDGALQGRIQEFGLGGAENFQGTRADHIKYI